ncbi:MAG TPA: hypothetical protein VFJ14_09930 [Nocardioidaceae bacterium]|nr:hypothetical protein [Nocardioidaceae bacterium]
MSQGHRPDGKLGLAMRELHRSEKSLAGDLLRVADRHRVEHEIYHVGRDLARWSQEHVRELSEEGRRYGLRLGTEHKDYAGILLSSVQQRVSHLSGRRPEPDLLLLADLRRLHRKAAGASLDWELLGQGAQAVKDTELLALTKRAHPQTLRQLRWTNAMLKMVSPQVLAS